MKPPCKAKKQRPPTALHLNSLGFKKSKPKNMEVKKNLKVWFNVNPEIISSEKKGFHKSLNELLNMKQQKRVLTSKSLTDLEVNKPNHKEFLKSCSSQYTLQDPADTDNHTNRRYYDNRVSSYDDSYLEDDISLKRRNIPRKSILKNKSHHASFSSGSCHTYRHLWERKYGSFNSFESENSCSSLGLNSDSITKLYKCSEPSNPITHSSEKEMFEDLTSSVKRLHISQFSLSEALNSSQYMNLQYGSQNHNEMSKLTFESENSCSSLGLNSDSITKLYKCSEPSNPITHSSEKEMFEDLTSSVKRKLHISQFSLSEALNSSQYMNLQYGSQNYNEMCKLMFGHASNEISGELNSSVLSWSDKNNNSHTAKEHLSTKQDQYSSNSSTDKGETNNNASTLEGPQISFHLKSGAGTVSSSTLPHLKSSSTAVSNGFGTNSNCSCHLGKENYLTPTDQIQEHGEIKSKSKDLHQLDVKGCQDKGILLKCPVVNCEVSFTDRTLLAKHMSHLEHSCCNPAASLVNGILPTSASFLCRSCGHISEDENSCLQHMFREKHKNFLPTIPFLVFTCPQCLAFFPNFSLAIHHMNRSNHHGTTFSFLDDKNKRVQPCPIPMPYKIMKRFILRCQQADYVLHCENCLENLYTPCQLQFHLYNKHTVLSKCHRKKTMVDVFSTLLTDDSFAEYHQLIYRKIPERPLGIYRDCSLQSPVLNPRARSLKEFILQCGIININLVTASEKKLKDGCITSNSDTLALKSHLANDVQQVFTVTSCKHWLAKPNIGQGQDETAKKTFENHASMADNPNPNGKGSSKLCSEQNDLIQYKLQYKGNSSNVHSVSGEEINGPDSNIIRRDKHRAQDVYQLKRKCDFLPLSEPKRKFIVLAEPTEGEISDKSALCGTLLGATSQSSTFEHYGKEQLNDLSTSECVPVDNNISRMFELKGYFNTELDTNKDDKVNNYGLQFVNSLHDSSRETATLGDSEIKENKNTAYPDYIPLEELPHKIKHLPVERKLRAYWDCVGNKSPYKYSSSNLFYYKMHQQQQSVMGNVHVASMVKAATASQSYGYQKLASYQKVPNGPYFSETRETSLAECAHLTQMVPPLLKELVLMDRIIFADLENYTFFKYFRGPLLPETYVWGFIGARDKTPFQLERTFHKFPLYLELKQMDCVCLTTDIGPTKDAADFAICLAIAKLDDRLPASIPFFIVSRDKGFREVLNQMKHSQRRVTIVSPVLHMDFADFW